MSSSDGISATGHRTRVPTVRVMLLALHGLFCVLLLIGLIGSGRPVAWVLGGALAAAYALGLRAPSEDRRRSLWWLAAVSALWVALVVVAPTAAYLAFPLYFVVLHLLPRAWSLAAVAAITATVVATQATTSGGLTAPKVIGPCAGAAVAVLTAYGYVGMYREGRRRQQLIDDLVRTRSDLAASQREAGRLAERQRLAREIHDTLAQGLSSIVLLARSAETSLPEDAAAPLREIRATASANLAEARRFVAALTPPALEHATLGEALRRLAAAHPRTTFRLDGTPYPLPMEAEVALLRTTQEALANVARHARADHAAVTLTYHADQITLDVFDDGIGFDDGTPTTRPRFGLHGMRERIAELGGTLTIESARGEGTAVAVALPTRLPTGTGQLGDPSRSAAEVDMRVSDAVSDAQADGLRTEPGDPSCWAAEAGMRVADSVSDAQAGGLRTEPGDPSCWAAEAGMRVADSVSDAQARGLRTEPGDPSRAAAGPAATTDCEPPRWPIASAPAGDVRLRPADDVAVGASRPTVDSGAASAPNHPPAGQSRPASSATAPELNALPAAEPSPTGNSSRVSTPNQPPVGRTQPTDLVAAPELNPAPAHYAPVRDACCPADSPASTDDPVVVPGSRQPVAVPSPAAGAVRLVPGPSS